MVAKTRLRRAAERGMSLIEVLVAVAIGLIGILIMTQAYLTSDEFNRATLGAGGAQTNGNVALFTLEREVRMAGYGINHAGALACGNINYYYDPDYSSNLPGGTLPNITLAPVVIAHVAGAPPTVPDQITVMYATGEVRSIPSSLSDTMPAASSELDVDGVDTFKDNDLVLMVNDATPPVLHHGSGNRGSERAAETAAQSGRQRAVQSAGGRPLSGLRQGRPAVQPWQPDRAHLFDRQRFAARSGNAV